ARAPPREHDAVDADRGHGEHQEHADREVGELQRRLDPEDRHGGPERDHREREERGDGDQRRGEDVDDLVHLARDEVLLEGQLDAVGQRLQDAELPRPVGAVPVLHPGDDLPLAPDAEQHAQQQQDEDADGLEEAEPQRIVAEVAQRGSGVVHETLPIFTTSPATAPRSRVTEMPFEFDGTHTTRSGRSAIRTGMTTPPSPILILSPSDTPISAAVAAEISAVAGRAVPARYGSPSWSLPSSSRRCQVASTASPAWGSLPGRPVRVGGVAREPFQVPMAASSRRAAAGSGRPRWTSMWSAIALITRRSLSTPGTCSAASNWRPLPSQLTKLPDFSATTATGSTTSARSVTALARISRLTTNGVFSSAASAR